MASGQECDLCGLGCGKHPLHERVGDADRFFCCPGCLNVYVILWESGTIRSGQDLRQTEIFQRSIKLGLISNRNNDDERTDPPALETEPGETLILHVADMWCSSCAWLIEHALTRLPGILKVEASFATDLVKVRYRPKAISRERVVERIGELGYKASDPASTGNDAEGRDLLIRTGLAAFLWVNIMSFSLVLYAGYFEQISGSIRRGLPFVLMVLSTPVVFYCGAPILRLAFRGLLNRNIRMEVLLALGILAAYGYSVAQAFRGDIHLYFDTSTVIVTLVLAGKLIDRGAKEKASRWITALHRMMPNKVRLLSQGSERFVSIEALEPDQIFMVKAGERIPADGVVVEGESHADESLLTGEASPIEKGPGQDVAAGSINLDSVLSVRATRFASESTLARIIALVEQALSTRCDVERTVDRVARIFVPSVVVVAALTFVVTWLLGTASPVQCLMRSITVLVIACPCALGLATPLAITAAFGSASRRGILIRDSRVLEALRKVDTVVLDKTGTLTEGTFSLLEFVACPTASAQPALAAAGDHHGGPQTSEMIEPGESLSVLASLEQYSEHPLGSAVMRFAREQGIVIGGARSVQVRKGRGITGIVNGRGAFAGNRQLAKELGAAIDPESERDAHAWESQGKTVCFIGWDKDIHAIAVFGDKLKHGSHDLISNLKLRGIDVHLVSGDSAGTTKSTAARLGIDSYESEVLPEEKVERVRRLQENGSVVAMVGDGINDAPALAQADLSIAMGSGTDIAMKAASVVLMNHSFDRILEIFDLSQKTLRVVRQNLFWAFFYNIVGISLAVTGVLNPIFAACAMLLSSTSVVANSMRLARNDLATQP